MRGPYWTTKELAILRAYYPEGGTKAVAERINRSIPGIRQAAKVHGVKANKEIYKPINRFIRGKQ
jgi:predicted secreted Zn-dependent protease